MLLVEGGGHSEPLLKSVEASTFSGDPHECEGPPAQGTYSSFDIVQMVPSLVSVEKQFIRALSSSLGLKLPNTKKEYLLLNPCCHIITCSGGGNPVATCLKAGFLFYLVNTFSLSLLLILLIESNQHVSLLLFYWTMMELMIFIKHGKLLGVFELCCKYP